MYYKKSSEANTLAGWKFVEANGTTSPFDFTIDYSVLTGGSASVGDVIQYFVVAQDNAAPTVSINSGSFAATPSSVALLTAQFPIGGTINSYAIQASLSGIKTVCPSGCDYTTLTVAGGAFDAINNSVVSGNLTLQIAGDLTTETGAILLNEFASPYTLTIKPTGAARNISGTSAVNLITLNGADNVTIDGALGSTANTVCPPSAATRDLTITNNNTGTSSVVVDVQNASANNATSNTIKNCNIVGNASTTTFAGIYHSNSTTTPNTNNSFINNSVSKSQLGIVSLGTSAAVKNTGTVINQNSINSVSPNNVQIGGIAVAFDNGALISGNNVSGINSSSDAYGISLGVTSWTATTTTGSEVSNATISNNIIGTVQTTGANSASGILVGLSSTGVNQIINNSISGVIGNSTPGDLTTGIFTINATGSSTRIYHNTVIMSGDRGTGTTGSSLALAVGGSDIAIDIRNNILVNKQTTASTGKSYAIGLGYSTFANLTSNNNDLFASGTSAAFSVTSTLNSGTNSTSLSAWQTTTGKDAASMSVDPAFTSSTDLRPISTDSANISLYNGGANLTASVPSDIDCGTRSTTPSLGFKEFTPPTCVTAVGGTASGSTTLCNSGTPTITATGYSSGIGSTYQWISSTVSADYPNAGSSVSGQTNPASLSTGVVSTTTYYWLRVTCGTNSSTDNSSLVTVTVSPSAASISGPSSKCANDPAVTLTENGGTGTSWLWSPGGATTQSISVNPASTTNYTVQVTSPGGCVLTSAVKTLTVNPNPAGVTATATSTALCAGDTVNLTSSYTATSVATAGMSGYNVTRTTGTPYTSIFPATNVTSWRNNTTGSGSGAMSDDNLSNTQPIGFSFVYNGTSYSNFLVSTNGFITFNTATTEIGTSSTPYGFTNNWTGSPAGLVLAPNWDDLQTASNAGSLADLNASINYATTGTTGSRILTVEWKNMQDFSTTSTASYNWQIKLYEADNHIEFVYGTMTQSAATVSNSVGLSSASVSTTPTAAELLSQTTVNTGTFGFTNQNSLTPVPASNTTISFAKPSPVYSWTGPNGFTSALANPSIASATTAASGVYNLVVSNSVTGCQSAQASTATVTVSPPSVGGTATADQTICSGSQPLDLTLSGNTGDVTKWQKSTDAGFTSPVDIANTTTTLTGAAIGALTADTWFRAVVKSGTCATANSVAVHITVNAATVAGSVTGGTTICEGSTSGLLTLAGHTGTIVRWESAVAPFSTWSPIANTTATYTSGSLIQTTQFRAVVQSGVCAEAASTATTVTVDPTTVAGSVTGGTTICEGSTSGLLTLGSHTGTIVRWESAVAPFSTWSPIANTVSTYTSGALTQTTQFRAVVQSGTCPEALSGATTVTVDPATVAGAVTGGTTICEGSTSGTLTLAGHTGTIVRWESAVAPFSTWNPIANTTSNYTSGILTQTTEFRAVVQNGSCAEAFSSTTTVTVDPATIGGSVTGGTTICEGSTSGTLTLAGYTGTIVRWESAVAPFTTWNPIANTISTYTSGTLTETTEFRAVVQSGSCTEAASSATTVTVNPATVGGSVTGGTTICEGSTSGTLTLAGHTGTIVRWESAVAPFSTWSPIANTISTYTSGTLTETTQFRAVVQSGSCTEAPSSATTVTVTPATVAGSVIGGTTICEGSTSGTLTLAGHTGTIVRWESSVAPFSTWSPIANTIATYTSVALTQTTEFRAVVQNGSCTEAASSATTVTVDPATVGGSVTGGTTICEGSTSGTLTLAGHTGTIIRWESAVAPFSTWSPIANTTNTYMSGALTQTTEFRAVVQSGSCTEAASSATTVTVTPATVAGSVTGGTTICEGSTSGTLTLAGHTGTIVRWESAVAPFSTWSPIANTTSTYTSGALTQTTEFRAVVQNGSCTEAFSSATTVTVDPTTVGGSVTGGATICEGSTSGTLTFTGHTGTIVRWESAVAPFSTWSPIANTTSTYTSGALTQTTEFRTVVQSGSCPEAASSATTVTVTPATVGGSVTGGLRFAKVQQAVRLHWPAIQEQSSVGKVQLLRSLHGVRLLI
ncbi:beta strand repeat-containing protein [Flavobacterium sp. 3HN19-14]|uniref:beta strand repeat-containing protein n=1 Tax=Flavobacterium sp. 3HN19-14 TaxID=3448133 RepID=UPI003EE046DA